MHNEESRTVRSRGRGIPTHDFESGVGRDRRARRSQAGVVDYSRRARRSRPTKKLSSVWHDGFRYRTIHIALLLSLQCFNRNENYSRMNRQLGCARLWQFSSSPSAVRHRVRISYANR